MTKKKAVEEEVNAPEKFKVETGEDNIAINGHVLKHGTVIELSEEDIKRHRNAGVPLLDVKADDDREVYDVSDPYEAKEEADGDEA
jgi:hypothetical protein